MSTASPGDRGELGHAIADAIEVVRGTMAPKAFAERVVELIRDSGELLTPDVAALVALDELGLAPRAEIVAPVYAKVLAPDELEAGLDNVVVEGRLRELRSTRTFARGDGARGFVTNATVEGPRGIYGITLWDEHIQPLVGLAPGTNLRFEGLYTKERQGQIELHTGRDARITVLDDAAASEAA